MLKKCKVVMLPTNQKASIAKYNNTLYNTIKDKDYSQCVYQHLYIISNDKIEEGSIVIDNNIVGRYNYDQLNTTHDIYNDNGVYSFLTIEYFKKVISTTDSNLKVFDLNREVGGFSGHIPLPYPSKSFITKFIESYNSGKLITDVMVEYVEMAITGLMPVIRDNNTIIISPVKDSWNREELVSILTNFGKDVVKKESHLEHMFELYATDWISNNL